MKYFLPVKTYLEKINTTKDNILFTLIRPYWPRAILPNHLTITRLFIGVCLFLLLFYFNFSNSFLIITLFCIGALTDFIDGPIARAFNKETKLGAILDGVADAFLIFPIAIYSLLNLHALLLIAVVLVSVINGLIYIYYQKKNMVPASEIIDKTVMVLQSVVFAAILILLPNPPHLFFVYLISFSVILDIISIFYKIFEMKNLPAKIQPHANA